MSKNKHRKFAELNTFPNVIQPGYRYPVNDHPLKGNWNKKFFCNNNPIILEIGCGKGEYTIGLAKAYPQYNFVGIDIKGNRMWSGAKTALENAISNVGFLRIQAEHLYCFFGENEVAGIWITFPDPQPNKPRIKKRLTSPRFLDIYQGFTTQGAPIHLKTDNYNIFEYTLGVIKKRELNLHMATRDLYGNPGDIDPIVLSIQTYYENMFLDKGEKICFIRFSIN